MADELLFEVKDRVAIMTLNRPEALNAFTPEILTGWVRRLEEAQRRARRTPVEPSHQAHPDPGIGDGSLDASGSNLLTHDRGQVE